MSSHTVACESGDAHSLTGRGVVHAMSSTTGALQLIIRGTSTAAVQVFNSACACLVKKKKVIKQEDPCGAEEEEQPVHTGTRRHPRLCVGQVDGKKHVAEHGARQLCLSAVS
jgi:hypothetical protein